MEDFLDSPKYVSNGYEFKGENCFLSLTEQGE